MWCQCCGQWIPGNAALKHPRDFCRGCTRDINRAAEGNADEVLRLPLHMRAVVLAYCGAVMDFHDWDSEGVIPETAARWGSARD